MTRPTFLAFLLAAGGALLAFALAAAARDYARTRKRLAQRLTSVRPRAAEAGPPPASAIRRIGRWLAGTALFGSAEVGRLQQNLYAAGYAGDAALEQFIGLKLALAALFVGFAAFAPGALGAQPDDMTALLLLLGGALAGLRGPDAVLGAMASRRREQMEGGLPDALDLLVVCAEAGVGLELGLDRVAQEMRPVHPALAVELGVTVSEMRLLPDRLQALTNMGERVRLDSVRAIASTLSQTLKYGTPLGKVLRTLASDLRLTRQTRMEARAARLPVLITVPMILFILPATTLVVAGPAFLQLVRSLGQIAR